MVSGKIWTNCSIKLKNKSYPYALTGNTPGKLKLENIENINKRTKLVPLLSEGEGLGIDVVGQVLSFGEDLGEATKAMF